MPSIKRTWERFKEYWTNSYQLKTNIEIESKSMNYSGATIEKETNEDTAYKDAIKNIIDAYGRAIEAHSSNFTNTTAASNIQLANIMQAVNSLTQSMQQMQMSSTHRPALFQQQKH